MVLAILQHSYLNADSSLFSDSGKWFMWTTTNLAPVAFVAVSGAASSYSLLSNSDWCRAYRQTVVRAFVLLTVAHFLINLSSYPWALHQGLLRGSEDLPWIEQLALGFPITDTIAVCLLISPVFVVCFGQRLRAIIIVVLIAATIAVTGLAVPTSAPFPMLREALFGVLGDFRISGEPKTFWWPLVPWLGVFLSGTIFGECLARFAHSKLDARVLVIQLIRSTAALGICSLLLTLGYMLLKAQYLQVWGPEVFRAMYPSRTTTLLPGYLALLTLILAAITYVVDVQGHFDRVLWVLSVFGRTSVFAFIIQFLIVESGPAVIGLTGSLGPLGVSFLFGSSLVLVWLLSYLYGRVRGG
ncbi:MAG: DUF1624 domain-containing protein [Sterolibacteriaceae bacterium]|nr:DUF1624 domain-containing protein [Candidatus Methylophosphatis haderslevensis]